MNNKSSSRSANSQKSNNSTNKSTINQMQISDLKFKIQELKQIGNLVSQVLDEEDVDNIDQIMLNYAANQQKQFQLYKQNVNIVQNKNTPVLSNQDLSSRSSQRQISDPKLKQLNQLNENMSQVKTKEDLGQFLRQFEDKIKDSLDLNLKEIRQMKQQLGLNVIMSVKGEDQDLLNQRIKKQDQEIKVNDLDLRKQQLELQKIKFLESQNKRLQEQLQENIYRNKQELFNEKIMEYDCFGKVKYKDNQCYMGLDQNELLIFEFAQEKVIQRDFIQRVELRQESQIQIEENKRVILENEKERYIFEFAALQDSKREVEKWETALFSQKLKLKTKKNLIELYNSIQANDLSLEQTLNQNNSKTSTLQRGYTFQGGISQENFSQNPNENFLLMSGSKGAQPQLAAQNQNQNNAQFQVFSTKSINNEINLKNGNQENNIMKTSINFEDNSSLQKIKSNLELNKNNPAYFQSNNAFQNLNSASQSQVNTNKNQILQNSTQNVINPQNSQNLNNYSGNFLQNLNENLLNQNEQKIIQNNQNTYNSNNDNKNFTLKLNNVEFDKYSNLSGSDNNSPFNSYSKYKQKISNLKEIDNDALTNKDLKDLVHGIIVQRFINQNNSKKEEQKISLDDKYNSIIIAKPDDKQKQVHELSKIKSISFKTVPQGHSNQNYGNEVLYFLTITFEVNQNYNFEIGNLNSFNLLKKYFNFLKNNKYRNIQLEM